MPARHLLADMSSSEITEMMAFYELDPFGEQRADLRNAMLMAQTYNINRSKRDKALRAADFMPYSDHKKPESYKLIQAAIRGMKPKDKHGH